MLLTYVRLQNMMALVLADGIRRICSILAIDIANWPAIYCRHGREDGVNVRSCFSFRRGKRKFLSFRPLVLWVFRAGKPRIVNR